MKIKNSLMYLFLTEFLILGQAYAGWEEYSVVSESITPKVASPVLTPAQKSSLLSQRDWLVSRKSRYQALITKTNENIVKRPDLIASLQEQLNNYEENKKSLDIQISNINRSLDLKRYAGDRSRATIKPDNSAIAALASGFGLKSKALVHFPELIPAKNIDEKKVIINKKLVVSGYKLKTASEVTDEKLIFEKGTSVLAPESNQRLNNFIALYHRYMGQIDKMVVRVHTNSTGDKSYNLKLSKARANVIKVNLIKGGLPASVVVVQALGESELLPNIHPSSELNNRVEYSVKKR